MTHHVPSRRTWLCLCLGILLLSLLAGCTTPAKTDVPLLPTTILTPVKSSPTDTQLTPVVPAATQTTLPAAEATATKAIPTLASSLPDDPMAAITSAIRKLNTTFPHTTLSDTVAGDTTIETFVEFGAADVVRMKSSTGSIMFIHEKFYRLVDGKWVEETPQGYESSILTGNDPANVDIFISMVTSVTLIGNETLNGVACRVYEYTTSTDEFGVHSEGKARLWIAIHTGLPMKQVIDSTTGEYSATITQILTYELTTPIQP